MNTPQKTPASPWWKKSAPPITDCPPNAVETMDELEVPAEDRVFARIGDSPGLVAVREGPGITAVLGDELGKLPAGTVLRGRLLLTRNRVYGRFLEARTPRGETYPICLELYDDGKDYEQGAFRYPDLGNPPETALINAAIRVRAVLPSD